MHDVNGKTLHVGDEVTTYASGLAKITSVEDEDNVERQGAMVTLTYPNGDKGSCRLLEVKAVKVRTWKEIATEALQVQDACNLSGVVISFGNIIREVRARLDQEGNGGTDTVNQHAVCILFSDKIAHLTGTQTVGHVKVGEAYTWAHNQKEGK